MTKLTMEEYVKKTREDYGSRIARPKFDKDAKFELKGQFLKELLDNTFSGSKIRMQMSTSKEFLRFMQEVILFYKGLDVPTRQILDSKAGVPRMKADEAKKSI
ncbi:hypothetical protein Tco_0451024 [Tanacetum coccineum]